MVAFIIQLFNPLVFSPNTDNDLYLCDINKKCLSDSHRSAAHMCITYDTVNRAFLDVQNRHSE